MRYKNRFLIFEITWKDSTATSTLDEAALLAELRDALHKLCGDVGLGAALASLQVKHCNPVTNLCVVRCSRDEARAVWAAATLVTALQHRACALRALHVSGSVGACRAAALALSDAKAAAATGRLGRAAERAHAECTERLRALA